MLNNIIINVRKIAYGLRPDGLDKLGLIKTVQLFCEDFYEKNKIKVNFFSAGMKNLQLDFDTKITLFRVIQECLNNIRKHSGPGKAVIRLVASFPNIILRIEDNGKGFDVGKQLSAAFNEKQMGLRSM